MIRAMGRIVVGIDGSEHSAAALRWAAEEAKFRDAKVEAIHAWTYVPVAAPADAGLVPVPWTDSVEALRATQEAAERIATDHVHDVLGADHGVTVSLDLLVVGNRGRGALKEALLGSTSGRVADHAPCPVVIVRAPKTD
jgi:nucleotide-binding universal stress UspA family protein